MSSSETADPTARAAGTAGAAGAIGTAGTVDGDHRAARLAWWLVIAEAIVSVVLGVIVVVWPDATLMVGAVLFGLWLLVHGVVDIVRAVTSTSADGALRALSAVIGVVFVIGGVICLRNVLVSLATIATVIGLTWLVAGIVRLASAFGPRFAGRDRTLLGVLGAVLVLGGLVVLLWPRMTLLALVYLTGIGLIVTGIVQFLVVLRTRPRVQR